jgi:hypothetical protein
MIQRGPKISTFQSVYSNRSPSLFIEGFDTIVDWYENRVCRYLLKGKYF